MIAAADEFRRTFDVSRETVDRLAHHLALLAKWSPRINLVSHSTLPRAWQRHVTDSAQLWPLRPPSARLWVDLGSGAGFPGLVVAALAAEHAPGLAVHLVESDHRKAAFLATAIRETGLAATVHPVRLEALVLPAADVLSARALAPLAALIAHTAKLRRPGGTGLFPKGATVHKEVEDARRRWIFSYRLHPSRTDPAGRLVELGAIDGPRPDPA